MLAVQFSILLKLKIAGKNELATSSSYTNKRNQELSDIMEVLAHLVCDLKLNRSQVFETLNTHEEIL